MNKLLGTSGVLLVVGSVLCSPALTKTVKHVRSAAARLAVCRADCRPENYHANGIGMHGMYRSYSQWDPHLVSPEGKREYAACVKACVSPLPSIYVQKLVFALGLQWFGMTQNTCFECHATSGPHSLLPHTGVRVQRRDE